MNARRVLFIFIWMSGTFSLFAQDSFVLPVCESKNGVQRPHGDHLKVLVPKGAKKKTGRDVDYAYFNIGFGSDNKGWVWLSGIYGPSATSGTPPKQMTEQVVTTRRTWSFKDVQGVDIRGRRANGNHWRYLGMYGESIHYFDVSQEAADYFDKMLDAVCFNPYGGIGL